MSDKDFFQEKYSNASCDVAAELLLSEWHAERGEADQADTHRRLATDGMFRAGFRSGFQRQLAFMEAFLADMDAGSRTCLRAAHEILGRLTEKLDQPPAASARSLAWGLGSVRKLIATAAASAGPKDLARRNSRRKPTLMNRARR